MKRLFPFPIIIVVILSLCTKQKPDATSSATVKTTTSTAAVYTALVVKGNVTWSADDRLWDRLEMQIPLAQGSYVETGKNSVTTLKGSIGDIVQMGELAKVQLITEELKKQGERVSLAARAVRLFRGNAKFTVEKGKGKFTVETPSARVQVKGTIFTVSVDSTGKTEVAVIEGVVDVIQLSDTSKVKELRPGEVLRGDGENAKIERCEKRDTLLVSEETIEKSDDSDVNNEETSKTADKSSGMVDTAAIKKSLTPSARYNSKATEQAGMTAAQKIDEERKAVEQNIEEEKASFAADKEKSEQEHDAMKTAAELALDKAREEAAKKLEKERNESDVNRAREGALKKMQKERSTVNEPSKMSGGSKASDDSFDELRRRRGE